jgi:hypothetical protein
VRVQLDAKYLKYDGDLRKISQVKIADSVTNLAVKFTLTNEFNVSSVFTMRVEFVCPQSAVVSYIPPYQNISESKVKVQYPAQIASMSRDGVVDIRFYLAVNVPNLT